MSPISIRRRRRRHVAPLLFAALSVAGLASARIVVGAMPAPDQSPPDLGPLLVPRYFHNESEPLPAHELRERQVGGLCELGSHPCNDLGAVGSSYCCQNNLYCILSPSRGPACCAIGSNCDSPCNATDVPCVTTTTATLIPPDLGASPVTEVSTVSTCCPRACPSPSSFRCAVADGGGCCPYGAICASSSCLFPLPTTTTIRPSIVPAPPGCTTGQFSCAPSEGGGCCDTGKSCTATGGGLYCGPTPSANGTSSGLSVGARAGIGAGVAVGVVLVVAIVVWACVVRRRAKRLEEALHAAAEAAITAGQGGADDSNDTYTSGEAEDRYAGGAAAGRRRAGTQAMSEVTGYASTVTGRHSRISRGRLGSAFSGFPGFRSSPGGGASAYSGPDAVAGPFTERDGSGEPIRNGSMVALPGDQSAAAAGVAAGAGHAGDGHGIVGLGVGDAPQGPNDIRAPVEIDSAPLKNGAHVSVTQLPTPGSDPGPETIEGRFELYGSEAPLPMPSPAGAGGSGNGSGSGSAPEDEKPQR